MKDFGHWKEFYRIFEETLKRLNREDFIVSIKEEEQQRDTLNTISQLLKNNGFEIVKCIEDSFTMNFMDGTAFLNHHFTQCGWLESWFKLFPADYKVPIFKLLEQNLNDYADQHNGLKLTVPMAYIEGEKV